MGNQPGGLGGPPGMPGGKKGEQKKKKKKFERKQLTRVGKKKKRGPPVTARVPEVAPRAECKLRKMKLERIKDFLLLEKEFMQNQEALKPKGDKDQLEMEKVEELRPGLLFARLLQSRQDLRAGRHILVRDDDLRCPCEELRW